MVCWTSRTSTGARWRALGFERKPSFCSLLSRCLFGSLITSRLYTLLTHIRMTLKLCFVPFTPVSAQHTGRSRQTTARFTLFTSSEGPKMDLAGKAPSLNLLEVEVQTFLGKVHTALWRRVFAMQEWRRKHCEAM